MKRVVIVSPMGDKIEVTKDQVDYMVSIGWKLEGDKPVKLKIKPPKEVMTDGNI